MVGRQDDKARATAVDLGAYGLRPKDKTFSLGRYAKSIARFSRKKPLGAFGAAVLLLLIFTAIFAPWLATHDVNQIAVSERLEGPSASHFFGTDDKGRDIYSAIVLGARISVSVGLIAVGVSLLVGIPLGLTSGFFGGKADSLIQRVMDMQMAIPGLILVMTAVQMLGASVQNVMIVLGISMTPSVNRVVRGSVLVIKQEQYIQAAQSTGVTNIRLMFRHILPNVAAPVIIIATGGLGTAILVEASLSYLGLGTPPPTPSWGRMLSGSSQTYFESAWWMAVIPGIAISLAVLGFNLLGDALRDIWDPRLRGR